MTDKELEQRVRELEAERDRLKAEVRELQQVAIEDREVKRLKAKLAGMERVALNESRLIEAEIDWTNERTLLQDRLAEAERLLEIANHSSIASSKEWRTAYREFKKERK